jgi:hypothetical protein
MDASEFFNTVVKRNYEEWTGFTGNQDDFRLLWNAIVSMNTVPEYLALDELGYANKCRARCSTALRTKYATKTKA